MKLFRTNKSQASSIDRANPHSRDSSPTHLEPPNYPPSQPYNTLQAYVDPVSATAQDLEYSHQYDPGQTHPAHLLARSQSHRQSLGPDSFHNQPSLNVIAPTTAEHPVGVHQENTEYNPTTQFGQQRTVHVDKEPKEYKKSKKSFFGFSAKEKEAASKIQQSQVGRTGSLLRKGPLAQSPEQVQRRHPEQLSAYQHPDNTNRYSTYLQSQESLPPESASLEASDDNSASYERYYRQQGEIGQQDSPHSSQNIQFSPEQGREGFDHPHQYQHLSAHQETTSDHGEYQRSIDEPSNIAYDPQQQLRPPSPQSLGPPSPTLNPEQSTDSRPSTSTNQSRYSTQSTALQPPQQLMPRGDPPNGGLRQHLGQQRDPRAEEAGQSSYSSQPDSRARISQQVSEQGRASPAPRTRENAREMDFDTLLQKHEELQTKYSKVKRYYFEKDAQVMQLQNTVANQRMSMSRTSLDDAQYHARFERLNGAIRDLAFSIRKDWALLPPWLSTVCNHDAHKIGQKEMTAAGRAFLSRWVYDNVFYLHFHPALDMGLSAALKTIERNIRNTAPIQTANEEQKEDSVTKITNWRLVTIEGLHDQLANSHDHFNDFVSLAVNRLIEGLKTMLNDPPPPTLLSGAQMIVELAAGILGNLPNESRDVYVEYYLPGTPVSETHMKIEGGIAPLTQPGVPGSMEDGRDEDIDIDPEDRNGAERERQSIENEIREASAKATAMRQGGQSDAGATSRSDTKSKKSSGLFGGLVGKKSAPPSSGPREMAEREMAESNEGRIRFAAFLAVEVRGKGGKEGGASTNVLYRAPCFGYN